MDKNFEQNVHSQYDQFLKENKITPSSLEYKRFKQLVYLDDWTTIAATAIPLI